MSSSAITRIEVLPGPPFVVDPQSGLYTAKPLSAETALPFNIAFIGHNEELLGKYKVTVRHGTPPRPVGSMPDIVLTRGAPDHVLEASDYFEHESALTFSLADPPEQVTIEPESGRIVVSAATLLAPREVAVVASSGMASLTRTFTVAVNAPSAIHISFSTVGSLAALGPVYPETAPNWAFVADEGGFGRLKTASNQHLHTAWKEASGDGTYRTLFRLNRADLPPSVLRRFYFAARIRVDGTGFHGVRVDVFEEDGPKLQVREYTGLNGSSVSIGTKVIDWKFGEWNWLDLSIEGESVRARVYAQNAPAPEWQIASTTRAVGAGACGPGGWPSLGASDVIDIRRIEFTTTV